jgi:hypothetical protein
LTGENGQVTAQEPVFPALADTIFMFISKQAYFSVNLLGPGVCLFEIVDPHLMIEATGMNF